MVKKILAIILTILVLFACQRKEQIELPHGLKMEEYVFSTSDASGVYNRHKEEAREFIRGNIQNRVASIDLSLENGVKVVSQRLNDEMWELEVSADGKKIYGTEVANLSGASGLVEVWSYDSHRALEVVPYPFSSEFKADVILDGQSLRQMNGYQEVFGFQLLAGRPFFFFRKDKGVGISYDGQESDILYDDVRYRNYWIGYDPDPVQYENMVIFTAEKENEQYLVVIGSFPE